MIWAFFILLGLAAVILMSMPLLRYKGSMVTSSQATPAILLDQLGEIARDLERGIISEAEAKAAEREIKRRILQESRRAKVASSRTTKEGRKTLLFSIVLVPTLAIGYYAYMGSPEISGIAYAERTAEREEAAKIDELATKLFNQLSNDSKGGQSEGWMLLGETYSKMGQYEAAANAFAIVSKRPEASSGVFSMLGEVLIFAEQGIVTPPAEAAIDKALALDPNNPAGIYYKAVSLSQSGASEQAYDLLVSTLNNLDGFYPWMETFVIEANRIGSEINKARISLASFAPMMSAPGPTGEDIANAESMTDEDRQAFIRSMVERLATRLEVEPEDLDGWMRLGNAYTVLGETDLAVSALEQAQKLLANAPTDDPRLQGVKRALEDLKTKF
ncbi:MAG: c-type cytochrome biogenesis protein CcmI [Pacificibacter sp.]|jgi:cytochrome c-type biogenesis protein CcmH|uniref:c-type cytochrome biogenesis protein CcmI n=1 Tax=Roseobacteraceae TaxID=2854170 RepID=UPI00321B20AB|nr:c-type cytochrome biogenesis protein CcmI [Amylibacter sp.]